MLALKHCTSCYRSAASPAAASSTLSSTAPARSTCARPQLWPMPPSAAIPCSWQAAMPRPPLAQPLMAALGPPMWASRPSAERTASRCVFSSLQGICLSAFLSRFWRQSSEFVRITVGHSLCILCPISTQTAIYVTAKYKYVTCVHIYMFKYIYGRRSHCDYVKSQTRSYAEA